MKPNSISGITCYVEDLSNTAEFYETLGFRRGKEEADRVTFYVNWFFVTFIAGDQDADPELRKEAELPAKGSALFLYTRAGVATSSIRYYERIGLLPKPDRSEGQRRYDAEVLGKLGFIGVAQSAGFKLREIKELIEGVDGTSGLAEPMRSLSSQKLGEINALLERTKAMKGWREVA